MDALPHHVVTSLLTRYRAVIEHGGEAATKLIDGYNTLRLADAALAKLTLNEQYPTHPTQITILGPTQAGKSTLVNLILDTDSAGVSALAGYTVHAQGFAVNCSDAALEPLQSLMSPLQHTPLQALDKNALEHYALEQIPAGEKALVDSAVIWDSPDFDSIESSGYRAAVLQTAAISDVLILMVSKDKYADKTVWDMLALVRTLGKPLIVCINKLDAADEPTVLKSFEHRHRAQFNSAPPPIVTLPFTKRSTSAQEELPIALPADSRQALQHALQSALAEVDRSAQSAATEHFVQSHWQLWMEPVNMELAALADWRNTIDDALLDAEQTYVNRYLDDPRKYDTFNRALAELLTLLELPGLGQTLGKVRELATWPARTRATTG